MERWRETERQTDREMHTVRGRDGDGGETDRERNRGGDKEAGETEEGETGKEH